MKPILKAAVQPLHADPRCLRMFRIGLYSLLLLFLVPGPVPSSETTQRQGLLWQVEGKRNTVYLLGSLHVMTPGEYPLPRPLDEAYQRCAVVVLEADPDEIVKPAFQEMLIRRGLYPSGQTLQQQLSSSTYRRLESRVLSHGLKMQEFDRFRPWLAGVTLGALEFQRLGFLPEYGIDQHYYGRARKEAKNMAFLETADFQIGLFASLVDAEAEALLLQMLDEMEDLKPMADDLLESWRSGNERRLYNLIHKGFGSYPALYEKIMLKRNRSWIPEIEKFLEREQDVLVIVGAGHLVGPESVIDLLRRKGHTLRP